MTDQEKDTLYSVILRLIDDGQVLTKLERRDLLNQLMSAHCKMTADEVLAATKNNRKLRIKRGTTTQNDEYIGLSGELLMDVDTNTLRVHDGETPGGHVVAGGASLPENIDYVVESWRADDGSSWYRKYASGVVDMGGYYNGNAATVTLPVELANTNYDIFIEKNTAPSYWATTHLAILSKTTSSFTVSKYGDNASMKIGWVILNAVCAE